MGSAAPSRAAKARPGRRHLAGTGQLGLRLRPRRWSWGGRIHTTPPSWLQRWPDSSLPRTSIYEICAPTRCTDVERRLTFASKFIRGAFFVAWFLRVYAPHWGGRPMFDRLEDPCCRKVKPPPHHDINPFPFNCIAGRGCSRLAPATSVDWKICKPWTESWCFSPWFFKPNKKSTKLGMGWCSACW